MTLVIKPNLGIPGSRLPALGLSILVHVAAVAGLAWFGDGMSPTESRRHPRVDDGTEELVLTPKDKVIWYDLRQPLPNVAPSEPADTAAPRAPTAAKDDAVLISAAPAASPVEQTVLQPDPRPFDQELKAPNVIGYRARPKPAPLPPPVTPRPPEGLTLDAPQVDTARLAVSPIVSADTAQIAAARPPPKRFVPRNNPASPAMTDTPVISSVPELTNASAPDAPNAAILSLRPTEKLEALPPEGTRRAQFGIATEKGDLSPGGSANPPDARLPGIAVRNPSASRPPSVNANSPELRLADTIFSFSAPLHPSSRRLPREVEARFATRAAYTVVVPKPPLPQYSGDWVIWFAETQPADGPPPLIRAPVPYLRTGTATANPAPGAAAMVAAILGIDGTLTQMIALTPRNAELAERIVTDLGKWRLHPARRRNQPVEVEVVISFGLN